MAEIQRIERDARIFQRDNFTCQYCGWKGDTFEKWRYLVVDHFKPKHCFLSPTGFDFRSYHADENLQTSCVDCNSMKCDNVFQSVTDAAAKIKGWIAGERRDYEKFFVPKIPR